MAYSATLYEGSSFDSKEGWNDTKLTCAANTAYDFSREAINASQVLKSAVDLSTVGVFVG